MEASVLQEVVFRITEFSLPNVTVSDLPGMPPPTDDQYEAVKILVHEEVKKKDNIVLCIDW